MLKVATPIQLPNLESLRTNESTIYRYGPKAVITGDDEIIIPNMGTFYRSPYNGRIRCKRVSKHPRILTEDNKKALPIISCNTETVDFRKCNKTSIGSSEGSDTNSDISSSNSSSNSSGLRGILTKKCEKNTEKKPGKRVKFHEQLENVRELHDVTTTKFQYYPPHHLTVKPKQPVCRKASPRATASDSDLLAIKKQHYDIERHSISYSDFENSSTTNVSRSSQNSTRSGSKSSRTVFKSPLRHSQKQATPRSDYYYSPRSDVRCYPGDVKLRAAKPIRPQTVMSVYSPKILQNPSGQKFVVCRYALPRDDVSVTSFPSQSCEYPMKAKHNFKQILPERIGTMGMCTRNFCNRDKATRIMRWLDSVDDVQTKEGRYAELFDTVFHVDRNG
ncbi:hypothetical protein SNE40_007938 [Patella caerulea]|uniref:Uncharacterized protein n=1 Tax=Patella caerulea TaxID=87958 RepID=A0AAN8K041_PATCE